MDGLRACAFLLVFLFHTWEFAGAPDIPLVAAIVSQNTRPDFFVALTGFVLFLPFARFSSRLAAFDIRIYLRRRLRRIVVPYYVALVVAVAMPQVLVALMRLLGQRADWQPGPSWGDWATHLSFTHIFFAEFWDGINGSLWTMSLEMQLYLIFPVVLWAYVRWGTRGLAGGLALSVAYRLLAGLAVDGSGFPMEFLVGANGLGRLGQFMAGIATALLVFRLPERESWRRPWVLVPIMATAYAVAVSPLASWSFTSIRELGLGMAFGSLIALVLTSPSWGRFASWRPLTWLGYRAYSLFLLHQPTMWYFSEMATKFLHIENGVAKLLLLWTAGLGVLVVLTLPFFMWVEKPCIAWSKRARLTSDPAQASIAT